MAARQIPLTTYFAAGSPTPAEPGAADAGADSRRRPFPPDQVCRLPDRLVVGAVDAAFDGEGAVVANFFQGAEAGAEVEVPATGLETVAVGDMDIDEVGGVGADAGRQYPLLRCPCGRSRP